MKKTLLAAVLALVWLAGCTEKPMESIAQEHLKKKLRAELGDAVNVTSFKKTGAAQGEVFGVKSCDLEYSYELLCKLPVPVQGLRRFSIENVILLDEFFKNQTDPWEKIDFTPVLRVRLDAAALKEVSEAYARKKSLLFCKPGDKVRMTGNVRLLLKENGWTAD